MRRTHCKTINLFNSSQNTHLLLVFVTSGLLLQRHIVKFAKVIFYSKCRPMSTRKLSVFLKVKQCPLRVKKRHDVWDIDIKLT